LLKHTHAKQSAKRDKRIKKRSAESLSTNTDTDTDTDTDTAHTHTHTHTQTHTHTTDLILCGRVVNTAQRALVERIPLRVHHLHQRRRVIKRLPRCFAVHPRVHLAVERAVLVDVLVAPLIAAHAFDVANLHAERPVAHRAVFLAEPERGRLRIRGGMSGVV
jgi:hypothetical protein